MNAEEKLTIILIYDVKRDLFGPEGAEKVTVLGKPTIELAPGGDGLANCELLCWECHKLTL